MKRIFTLSFIFISITAYSQGDTSTANIPSYHTYERYSTMATLSVGFVDGYRTDYSLPSGYYKSNTSGFSPIYGKLEYGLCKNISLAFLGGYDAFQYNFRQEYTGNGVSFTRYRVNKVRIFNGGLAGYYHLNRFIHCHHFDPFIGIGLTLNNIRYSAHPQGDSSVIKIDHSVTPYLKAGARYYISQKFSLFGDLGYDKQSIFSIGFSCRFPGKRKFF